MFSNHTLNAMNVAEGYQPKVEVGPYPLFEAITDNFVDNARILDNFFGSLNPEEQRYHEEELDIAFKKLEEEFYGTTH